MKGKSVEKEGKSLASTSLALAYPPLNKGTSQDALDHASSPAGPLLRKDRHTAGKNPMTSPVASKKRKEVGSASAKQSYYPIVTATPSSSRKGLKGANPGYVGHYHDDTRGMKFFIKLADEDSLQRLRIPDEFVQRFKSHGRISGQVTLLVGDHSHVKVQASDTLAGMYLTTGWDVFANSLEVGYLVTFEVVICMTWIITVYDVNGMQVRFGCPEE